MIENIDSKYIQTFEYENSINSDGNILGTCELGTATIQMINDSNTYSSLKGQWIKTIHGSFYIYDVAPVQEKVNIKLSCYDVKYKLDTPYDSSKYTFPMTLKTWRNSIFTECDVTYDNSDFPNSNLVLNEEPYIGDNPSNRQVMSLIAQAGASFVITDKNDKFYFKWFKNTTNNITDWLELTTEKESTNPINVVVLGRGDVEDNVYYPKTLPENKKELRIDNNYILDPQIAGEEDRRNDVIESIYNQVNGFSFIPFTIRTQNVENKLSIDLGDKVSYKDIWGNSLSSYVMTKKITYLGGNPSDDDNYEITLSAEEINETSTEYSYASSIEQRLSKVEVTTDKQNKKITALVEETTTKITSIENSIPKYQTELDIYNITIPVDSELKPLENKDYSVGYTTKFEGSEVESTISSQSENTGITFGLSNNKITLSVLTSTAITSLSNEFVIDFSYTKDSTTYTDSKKIIVTLALKGTNAEKALPFKVISGNALEFNDGSGTNEANFLKVFGNSEQEISSNPVSPSPDNPSEIECVKGINLLKGLSTPRTDTDYWNSLSSVFTPLSDGWGKWEYDNTSGTSTSFMNATVNLSAIDLKPNTTYTFVVEIRNSTISENSNAYLQIITNNATGAFKTGRLMGYQDINENKTIVFNSVTKDIFNGVTRGVDTYLRLGAGTKGTVEARISLFEYGNNISSTYVPYNTIQVKNNGKNLFDGIFELGIINGSTGQNGSSGNVDYIRNKNYIPVKELTKYKFSAPDYTGTSVFVYEYKADLSYNLTLNKTIPLSSYLTTNKDTKYIRFRTSIASTDTNMRFQLEEGIQATEYEFYQEKVLNIDLKGNELCSLPNSVKDELVLENGRAKIIKKIKKIILNGDGYYQAYTNYTGGGYCYYYQNDDFALIPVTSQNYKNSICSHFKNKYVVWGYSTSKIGTYSDHAMTHRKYFISEKQTVAEFKEWLQTNPVTLLYVSETPYEIDLGATEQLKTFEGVNNISNSENADMELKYSTYFVGSQGKNSYLHIKYSNDGATFTSNNGNDVGRYIGSYSDNNEIASTNFEDYSWQDTAIVVDDELDDLQNQINDTNKDLNNNYTNNTELNQKLEDQKQTITEEFSTKITQTKSEWQASVIEYINTNGVEKFVNTLVTIDIDGLKLSKSDEDIVSLLNNKGLYVSDGKLREDLSNLLMKVDRAGALFKLLEILGTIKEQDIIQKEKITDETYGECQAWYWIGDE